MLDVGVGSGRTSYTFSALCRSYLGVDFAPAMVRLSRERIGEDDNTAFRLADVRDLDGLNRTFDVVLFSFNGLDHLEPADRARALAQINGVLRDGGLFLFSTHSILGLPVPSPLQNVRRRHPMIRTLLRLRLLVPAARIELLNRRLDRAGLERRGWAMIRDGLHSFDLVVHYVMPDYQVAQLQKAEFTVLDVLDVNGRSVTPDNPGPSPWIHFLCRKNGERQLRSLNPKAQ